MKKKILIVIIIAFMIFLNNPSLPNVYAQQTKKMLCFGDSITYGYSVENNVSYAKLFAQNNGYELTDYSVVGMDSKQLYELVSTSEIDYNVDLITLWIGGNDFLNALSSILDENNIDLSNVNLSELKTIFTSDNFRNKMQEVIDNFNEYFNKTLTHIKQNSTCKIYVFNQYNPYTKISLIDFTKNSIFNLGLYTEEWIQKLNSCISSQNVKVVDTFTVIENTPDCVNAEVNILTSQYNLDPHLNLKGQNEVYDEFTKVYTSLPSEDKVNTNFTTTIIVITSVIVLFVIGVTILIIKKIKKSNKI